MHVMVELSVENMESLYLLYILCKSFLIKFWIHLADFQWKTPQDFGADNYMMPMGPPPGYNPYWNGMQPGMDGFVAPYAGAMQMMNYGLGPFDMPFGGVMPHDPFGMQNYMMPVVPPPRYFRLTSHS